MTDIEAFHALGQFIQCKRLLQFIQPIQVALARIQKRGERLLGVIERKLEPAGALAAYSSGEFNPVSSLFAQHCLDQILLLRLMAQQQFSRNVPTRVILGDKSRQYLLVA